MRRRCIIRISMLKYQLKGQLASVLELSDLYNIVCFEAVHRFSYFPGGKKHMTKHVKLLLAGALPLAMGYVLNFALYLPIAGLLMRIMGWIMIFLWFCLAYRLADSSDSIVRQSFFMCAFGLLMLALVLYQELVLGQYWLNILGWGPQIYFLPFLSAVFTLFSPVLAQLGTIRMWPLYICEWFLIFVVCLAGCWRKKKRLS